MTVSIFNSRARSAYVNSWQDKRPVEREKGREKNGRKGERASSVVGIDSSPVCPRDIICSSPYGARYETPAALKRRSVSQTRMRTNNLLENDKTSPTFLFLIVFNWIRILSSHYRLILETHIIVWYYSSRIFSLSFRSRKELATFREKGLSLVETVIIRKLIIFVIIIIN